MRFPVVVGTRSGRLPELIEPGREMREHRDVVEAAVGEGRAVEGFTRGEPADLAVQTVVVVVAGKVRERGLSVGERSEHPAVEDLAIEGGPEGLELAVGPGRVDLRLDLADLQLAQRLAEAVEHPGHPVHELAAVVAHEVQRTATQLDAVAQPHQDRRDLAGRRDAQPQDVAGVVVDQAEDPGLEIAVPLQLNEERAFDVDVPERIGTGALIARAALACPRGAAGAEIVEEPLDPPLADVGDLAPAQLGRDALGVPIRVQPHRDHDLLDPLRVLEGGMPRTTALGHECAKTAPGVRGLPAEEAAATALSVREDRLHPFLAHESQQSRAGTHDRELAARAVAGRRSSAARREETETWSLLIRVPEPATVRVADLVDVVCPDFVHAAQAALLTRSVPETTGNLS